MLRILLSTVGKYLLLAFFTFQTSQTSSSIKQNDSKVIYTIIYLQNEKNSRNVLLKKIYM